MLSLPFKQFSPQNEKNLKIAALQADFGKSISHINNQSSAVFFDNVIYELMCEINQHEMMNDRLIFVLLLLRHFCRRCRIFLM